MDILGYHISGLIGVGATFGSVYGAFAKFDADQSDENRKFVREWLLGLKVDDRQWAQFFKELFTKFFGERHLSVKCVGRSFLLSVVLFMAIWMYWYIKYGGMLFAQMESGVYLISVLGIMVLGIMIAVCICACADYLSLGRTYLVTV